MSSAATRSEVPRAEVASAALCLLLVVPFALFVLFEGSVAPLEYLKLILAMAAVSLVLLSGGALLFALIELLQAGRRSRWKANPRQAVKAAFVGRWAQDRLFSLAWPSLLFVLLVPSFNAFKQRILPQAGFVYDRELAAIDRALFGTDPGLFLHQWIGSPATTLFFDGVYHGWFLPATLGVAVVGLCAGTRTRAQYMLAYAAVWILLGAVFAFLVPAAGPAFYEILASPSGAEPFQAVHRHLVAAGDARFLTSLGNQAYLLENLGSPVLVVGGGISALPSVHNALAALFAVASFRAHKLLGIALSIFAFLIWIGSIYLNWHYAVDGLVGAAGGIAIWFGSGRLVDRLLVSCAREARRPSLDATATA